MALKRRLGVRSRSGGTALWLAAFALLVHLASTPFVLPRLYPNLSSSGSLRHRLTGLFYDSADYGELAENLAAGRGLSLFEQASQSYEPTAGWVPAYPLLLAAHLITFGPTFWLVFVLQAIVVASVVIYSLRLARILGHEGAGLAAAVFLALHPLYLVYSKAVLTDLWFSALFLVVVVWALRLAPTASDRELFVLGCTIGVATLFREVGVVLLLPVGGLTLRRLDRSRPRRAAGLAALAVGCLLVLTPWAARNAVALGGLIPLTTKTPRLLWMSSIPLPIGVTEEMRNYRWPYLPQLIPYAQQVDAHASKLPRQAKARLYIEEALKNYVQRPGQGQWVLTKTYTFWRSQFSLRHLSERKAPSNQVTEVAVTAVTALHWLILLGAGAGVLGAAWRRDHTTLWLFSLIVIYWLPHLLLWSEPRYQLPIYPILTVVAFATFARMGPRVRGAHRRADQALESRA